MRVKYWEFPQAGITPGTWAERCYARHHKELTLGWWYKYGDLLDDGDTATVGDSCYGPYIND